MTLIFMDSCRQPGNVGSQWTNFGPASADPTPILGLQHYNLDNDRTTTLQKNITADKDDLIIVSARIHMNAFDIHSLGSGDGGNDFGLKWRGGGGIVTHLMIKFTGGNGTISVERGGSPGSYLAESVTSAYPVNAWFFLEGKMLIHDSAGTVQVRVDGNDVINETGLDTRNGGADALIDLVTFGSAESNGIILRVCDIHIMNGLGSAPLNDLIGPHTIESLRADGAGNYTNWDPLAGTNWEAVDDPTEAVHDSDTTYVETSVAERDSYSFGNMVSGADPIAVQVKTTAKFTGTQQDFNTFLRRSSTDNDGPTETGTTSGYADRAITIYETDPIAAGAWTKANLEATEFGVRTT